jgi:hypothetical protein
MSVPSSFMSIILATNTSCLKCKSFTSNNLYICDLLVGCAEHHDMGFGNSFCLQEVLGPIASWLVNVCLFVYVQVHTNALSGARVDES